MARNSRAKEYLNKKMSRPWYVRLPSIICNVIIAVIVLILLLFLFLTITEYRPADEESLAIEGTSSKTLSEGDSLTVLTWNTGYGALGDNADFFMDGGTKVKTADKERTLYNVNGMIDTISALNPDVIFLQEADINSTRSNHVNETEMYKAAFEGYESSFATNFKVAFLPYPIPPIGKVYSGIETFSRFEITSSERLQLPIPFSWPVRMANLKRCLDISRVPIEGSDKELVLINLHLEAYDSGEGKILQTKRLRSILDEEYAKGNYVIAGGDFNQTFSNVDASAYPYHEGMWACGAIDTADFADGWQFLMDNSTPTCRSLDQVYAGADLSDFQYYMIDGFIVSANVKVESVETLDEGFVYTDHNPVLMKVTLE